MSKNPCFPLEIIEQFPSWGEELGAVIDFGDSSILRFLSGLLVS
jgi:hypothetical protein